MGEETMLNFSDALHNLKAGRRMTRMGWNGKGMHVMAQMPDENSKMSLPYMFISTVDGKLVPWVVSHTDLFADDWYVVDQEPNSQN